MLPAYTLAVLLLATFSSANVLPALPGLSEHTAIKVRSNLLQIATHSWELGTAAQALTELNASSLSVFSPFTLPPPTRLDDRLNASASDVINIATNIVRALPVDSKVLVDGDGAVGDPASLGVAVLLANWTRTNLSDSSFSVAASQQLNHLLYVAPRNANGAISHREDQVQLWADFVYMAPPFIAYYGALSTGDTSQSIDLLQEAYDQCRLYRDILRDADAGLWKHIVLGSGEQDLTHWGTGNAWAAAGMLRVLETIRHSRVSSQFEAQKGNLTLWIDEIVGSAWKHQQTNGTLLNVLDDPRSFADSSSTALLAAATFRLASITRDFSHVLPATRAFQLIQQSLDSDGWLLNTVDPLTFNTPSAPGVHSPEGQAFVLLLESAWRDLVASSII
ncbi:unnamed protein product [Somion occarium]|uniref:Six-hairpin glycosidase n=1 Tax=Somion occarium TaxID=3059160 RepID=A0ABP1D362_9APHY